MKNHIFGDRNAPKAIPNCACGGEPHYELVGMRWRLVCTSGCGRQTRTYSSKYDAKRAWPTVITKEPEACK